MPVPTLNGALGLAAAFRETLRKAAGADSNDARSCYELATAIHGLDTRNEQHRTLQTACQVIDDLVLAIKDSQDAPLPPPANP